MSTALGIPIQVLTEPDFASLRGSAKNRCFQRGMAVDDNRGKITGYKPSVDGEVFNHKGGFMWRFSLKTFLKVMNH